jgi:L-ascorbate metabolism protein UlaG (beta-lactamase superfamily)
VFHLWWLGQSGFLVKWGRHHLLLDPYLSDSLTAKYAATDKPHERMTARVVAPERLAFAAVVAASHLHTDHLDAGTLGPLLAANPELVIAAPEAIRAAAAERLGVGPDRLLGCDDGRTVEAGPFALTGVAAAHDTLACDERGHLLCLGFVVRFGAFALYHSGDTLRYEGQVERVRPHRVDAALLPINGRRAERRVAGNLDGLEAARLALDIGARVVIPCHYEMFAFNTEPPDAFAAEAGRIGQAFRILRCGERCTFTEGALSESSSRRGRP